MNGFAEIRLLIRFSKGEQSVITDRFSSLHETSRHSHSTESIEQHLNPV